MRIIIQRVTSADVTIEGSVHGKIGVGMMLLVGFESSDKEEDIDWMCKKIVNLRIFPDDSGVMNLSVMDINGEILVISQFTLFASTKKGNRPSYIYAAPPSVAVPLYESFLKKLESSLNKPIPCGIFGADMKVSLINDGPVTIAIDSKDRH